MRKDLKMIAIDLDGTLLRDDCTISQRTREAVEEAGRRGYHVVPTTGRSYRNARFVLKDFKEISQYIKRATARGSQRQDRGCPVFSWNGHG